MSSSSASFADFLLASTYSLRSLLPSRITLALALFFRPCVKEPPEELGREAAAARLAKLLFRLTADALTELLLRSLGERSGSWVYLSSA